MLERNGACLNITDNGWTTEELDRHIATLTEEQRSGVDLVYA